MRRLLPFLILCTLLSIATVTRAGDPADWTAWLHYGRHMTLIDSNGDVLREVDLPVPEGYDASIYEMRPEIGVSRDGHLVAYLFRTMPYLKSTELLIYDLVNNQVLLSYAPDEPGFFYGSHPDSGMFDETGRGVALAYSSDRADLRVEVLDVNQGVVLHILDTTLPELHLPADLTIMWPYIRLYNHHQITFTLELLDPDGKNPDLGNTDKLIRQSFTWDMATGIVQPDRNFPGLDADYFIPTGEILTPLFHPGFPPIIEDAADGALPNTVQVYDPIVRAVYPFFWLPNTSVEQAYFIQNGERILLRAFDHHSYTRSWLLIERDGRRVDTWNLPDNFQVEQVESTPTGFLYHLSTEISGLSRNPALPAIFEVNTRDDTLDMGRAVWSMNVREFQAYFDNPNHARLDIAWVHTDAPVGPFTPWAQLAEPVYAPTPAPMDTVILPTTLPPPIPLFQVGHEVRVQTIDGEILNLRAHPTRESDILAYVYNDTVLPLLDGPVFAEGFTWWRVRLPDGMEGWVVENDGELQTLIPI